MGAYFLKKQARSPILEGFGRNIYALLSFSGQQYKKNKQAADRRPDEQTCYVHVTELFYKEGKLTADRNKKVIPPADLRPANGTWGFVAD